jgi:hypothetical protein
VKEKTIFGVNYEGIIGRMPGKAKLFLVFFENDFKRAGDSTGRTNKLAHRAPTAVIDFNDFDGIIFHHQSAAGTNANA